MIWNIVRHGQTDWNVKHLFQGRKDIPLNDTGRAQARAAGEKLRAQGVTFVRVYSSPLRRAAETAALIAGVDDQAIIRDERLSEMDFGALDGTAYDRSSPALQAFFYQPSAFTPVAGMETFEEILARTKSFLDDLRREAVPGDGNLLIQTHGACMRALISNLDHLPLDDFWANRIDNCALVRYRCDSPADEPIRID